MKKIYVIVGLVCILSLFVGYAAGRGYKTYEINLEKKLSANSPQNNFNENIFGKENVNPNVYAPKIISLSARSTSVGGMNVKIETQNIRFNPELKDVVQNTGFANVFVNGKYVGRAYQNVYYISPEFLKSGTNTISVTLNANNGNVWWSKKGTLEARSNLDIVK